MFSQQIRSVQLKLHGTVNYLIKTGDFFLLEIRSSNNSRKLIFNINAVVLIYIIC